MIQYFKIYPIRQDFLPAGLLSVQSVDDERPVGSPK